MRAITLAALATILLAIGCKPEPEPVAPVVTAEPTEEEKAAAWQLARNGAIARQEAQKKLEESKKNRPADNQTKIRFVAERLNDGTLGRCDTTASENLTMNLFMAAWQEKDWASVSRLLDDAYAVALRCK